MSEVVGPLEGDPDRPDKPSRLRWVWKHIPLDKVASMVAGVGAPGLILVLAVGATGFVGAAAITAALSALGPGGMVGGVLTLCVSGVLASAVAEYGLDAIFRAVVRELLKGGETVESILSKVDGYPLSTQQKAVLREMLLDIQTD